MDASPELDGYRCLLTPPSDKLKHECDRAAPPLFLCVCGGNLSWRSANMLGRKNCRRKWVSSAWLPGGYPRVYRSFPDGRAPASEPSGCLKCLWHQDWQRDTECAVWANIIPGPSFSITQLVDSSVPLSNNNKKGQNKQPDCVWLESKWRLFIAVPCKP